MIRPSDFSFSRADCIGIAPGLDVKEGGSFATEFDLLLLPWKKQ